MGFRNFLASIALLAVGALMITGCASDVHSNVNTYSKLTADYHGKTIAIIPMDKKNDGSLQFDEFAKHLTSRLTVAGFRVVDLPESGPLPDYIALMDYGIDNGTQVASTYSVPTYGQTGVSSSYTTGTISSYGGGYGTYNGTTTYTPTYGVTGYRTGTQVDTVYGRYLAVDIWEPKKDGANEKVFEGKLTSSGSCGDIGKVIDPLMDSMFDGFPKAHSGEVVKPLNVDC